MKALKIVGLILLGFLAAFAVFRALAVTVAVLFLSQGTAAFNLGYWLGTVLIAALMVGLFLLLLKNVRSR